ncbi:MAG TPA: hypothetical protein VM536_18670 [Chloroflexia bacterium]|nr:hypothetical protein [Chloroflexia bacterium]
MDGKAEERRGDVGMGLDPAAEPAPTTPTVNVTLGGTAAGAPADHNPTIGAPQTALPAAPPPVIHNAGDSRPGESNPAAALTTPAGLPAVDTAQLLAAREAAEEAISRGERGAQPAAAASPGGMVPYADATADTQLARQDAGGRNTAPQQTARPVEYLDAPHTYLALGAQGDSLDGLSARVEAKNEANSNVIQAAESKSGLNSERNDYERREFGQGQTDEVRDDVLSGAPAVGTAVAPAPAVHALFSSVDTARSAIEALRDIGIPAAAISLIMRDGSDAGNGDAGGGPVDPAGETSLRRTSMELPNDEDLPATTAAMTDDPSAVGGAGATPGVTESSRGGLARDEGQITRIEAPADPDIYSDYAHSDADYRTTAAERSAQVGGTAGNRDAGAVSSGEEGAHVTAGSGAAIGAFAGLLVGLGALAIPGIGPLLAAGPLVGALTGLLAGGATGGIVGALIDAGVPHDKAQTLAGHVERGGVLLAVQTDHLTHGAVLRVLQANGADEVH